MAMFVKTNAQILIIETKSFEETHDTKYKLQKEYGNRIKTLVVENDNNKNYVSTEILSKSVVGAGKFKVEGYHLFKGRRKQVSSSMFSSFF